MSERGYAEQILSQREQLHSFLLEHQIIVPQEPLLDPRVKAPREWLIRGESHKERLLNAKQNNFNPQSGEWGTYGIFFGDCMKPLMYPHSGGYYLFRTEDLRNNWMVDPSPEYERALSEIAQGDRLNLSSISGGVEATDKLYHSHNIYQAKRGIATVTSSLAVEQAAAIIYTKNFITPDEFRKIPLSLQRKMLQLSI